MARRRAWSSRPRSAVVVDPLTRTSPSHAESSRPAASLDRLLAKVISDIERLEAMVALQHGMMRQSSPVDARRMERETERLAEGIEATSASLRQALSDLRQISGKNRVDRGAHAPRRAR